MEQELQFLLYDLPDESAKVQVVVRDETIWMTQKAMGVLFGVQAPAISKHLKNIFESGELNPEVVISKMETTTQHGAIAGKTQTSETNFYNLDAIISVGYRVNSTKATRFRQWAALANSSIHELKHSLVKGTRSCYAFPTANSQRLGLHWGPQVIEYCTAKAA